MIDFEEIVRESFLAFLVENKLAKGTIDDGCGNKATVTKNKHGFFKVLITTETTERGNEDG